MDRRDFFKTILSTPLLAPLLVGSPSSADDGLFLISNSPETYLPSLLEEIKSLRKPRARSFAFLDSHPQKKALFLALKASGWIKTSPGQKPNLTISFRPLQRPTPPSFTAVRAGKILDIRTKRLRSFWIEMNRNHPRSSCLTVATLQAQSLMISPGKFLRIYHNGRVVEEASLTKERVLTFGSEQGKLTVKIENGRAFIPSSSCRNKICCWAPPVSYSGERIVCAPNHFLLEIQGPGSIDTIIG
jgi:hypothetical protein